MPVPILLVTGFLGAGKTTLVNRVLQQADGRRIAAVVNDFGAVNIDAELIAGAEDGVVSLANGCICCSLEGDLLRTLSNLLRRTPRPEAIVIETSGVADPEDIIRNLMDRVIWGEAPLETVLCVADAAAPEADLGDPLLLSQLRAADLVAVSKGDLVDRTVLDARLRALSQVNRRATLVETAGGDIPLDLLFPEVGPARERTTRPKRPSIERFESFDWTSGSRSRSPVSSRRSAGLRRGWSARKGFSKRSRSRIGAISSSSRAARPRSRRSIGSIRRRRAHASSSSRRSTGSLNRKSTKP